MSIKPQLESSAVTWRGVRKVHPAAELFPLMSSAELAKLAKDIKANKIQTPIAIYKGLVLDGRNRLDAAEQAGIQVVDGEAFTVPTQILDDNVGDDFDPYAYVASANLHRRHLSDEQKVEAVKKLLKANPKKSNRQIDKEAGSNHHTVGLSRKKLEKSGDVGRSPTRTDTRGRKQPATKGKKRKGAPAESATALTFGPALPLLAPLPPPSIPTTAPTSIGNDTDPECSAAERKTLNSGTLGPETNSETLDHVSLEHEVNPEPAANNLSDLWGRAVPSEQRAVLAAMPREQLLDILPPGIGVLAEPTSIEPAAIGRQSVLLTQISAEFPHSRRDFRSNGSNRANQHDDNQGHACGNRRDRDRDVRRSG
jgi:hypothetical protein